MSIMDFFKTPPTDGSGASSSNPSSTPPPAKENLSDNPPALGPDGKIPGTDPNTQNPLDIYNKMFDNANKESDIQAPSFKIDPKILGEVSGKMDFTKNISPELLQQATGGDMGALLNIIKTVGQNSYRASLEHSTSLTDTFLNSRGEFESKSLANGVKSQLTSNALSDAPNYKHPVVKAELNRIANSYSKANPDASPQEVAKAAQKYLVDLYSALNPAAPASETSGKGEMDWSKYLNM